MIEAAAPAPPHCSRRILATVLFPAGFAVAPARARTQEREMPRSIHARAGIGAALAIVQEGGGPLRHVLVEWPSLIWVRAGRKEIRAGNVTRTAQQGEMLAVSAGSEIEVTNALPIAGPYEAFCLAFDPQLVAATEQMPAKARIVSTATTLREPPAYLSAAFQGALDALAAKKPMPDRILRHRFQEVLLGLEIRGWRFDARHAASPSSRVRQLLGSNPAKHWKIAEVGRAFGMSEATLRRRLQADGVSFREIITRVRMGRALTLLQASELSITQISLEAGYDSLSQFTARFRRHFGQSPRRLRERAKG
jgi:AraC-like DNA-binding protein